MLASAYLDWDAAQYSQKALNAVGLANAVSIPSLSLLKGTRCLGSDELVYNKRFVTVFYKCI